METAHSTSIRGAAGGARHIHRFLMETAEAAIRRQPAIPHCARTVLGACACGATTQARAVVTALADADGYPSSVRLDHCTTNGGLPARPASLVSSVR